MSFFCFLLFLFEMEKKDMTNPPGHICNWCALASWKLKLITNVSFPEVFFIYVYAAFSKILYNFSLPLLLHIWSMASWTFEILSVHTYSCYLYLFTLTFKLLLHMQSLDSLTELVESKLQGRQFCWWVQLICMCVSE